jgi:hypothetical protein
LERLESLDRDALIQVILDQQRMIEQLRVEIVQLKRRGSAAPFSGSAREFVKSGTLRGLLGVLKNDVLGVGNGHTLYFQE